MCEFILTQVKTYAYDESNRKAFIGEPGLALGGGIRCKIACNTPSTPFPLFAEIWRTSFGSIPNVARICEATMSGWAAGRSI